jgi:2-succinyl-5-enolpyruvyl-6-hydroxy-3-cyclohexene-1-carboxylate synthase
MMKDGLKHVYFCTGARNHELLDFFEEKNLSYECDERAASFKALGHAKLTDSPVAVCTTSGTAVSECLSALIEAYYSETPFILITGDRPKRMHGKASPQTIDHETITRGHRKTFLELTLAELETVDITRLEFPAHINVLIEKTNEISTSTPQSFEPNWHGFQHFLKAYPKPLFLFSHEKKSMRPLVEKFINLNLPFYSEVLSHCHEISAIKYERDLLRAFKENQFTSVVRIGHTPMTKLWRLLEKNPLPQFSFDARGFQGLSYGTVMPLCSTELMNCPPFWENLLSLPPFSITQQTENGILDSLIVKYPKSDISRLNHVFRHIQEDSLVYLGNSLVIRFFELIQNRSLSLFGNRGVNGIDGQLSTAIGLANATKKTVYCFLGDLTTFYDLSSFRDIPANLKLIILNNSGGRIFETMKLDPRIYLSHHENFEAMASAFNLSYAQNDAELLNQVSLLELISNPAETKAFLEEWDS